MLIDRFLRLLSAKYCLWQARRWLHRTAIHHHKSVVASREARLWLECLEEYLPPSEEGGTS